ncbi:MAG: hypothetical protein LUE89_11975 [Clostridiales bacterium]|nr:hypothetical protein [Clostridiales bacterium]
MGTPTRKGNVDAEYNILRIEILQYIEEYQTLRNMMYVGTISLLGINTANTFSVYLYLLPLAIILPSYVLFYEYWKSVSVASLYMQVFLEGAVEQENMSLHMWETRFNKFGKFLKENFSEIGIKPRHILRWSGMNFNHIPYFVCATLCFVLYGVGIAASEQSKVSICFSIVLGAALAVLSLAVFIIFRKPDSATIEKTWQALKAREEAASAALSKQTEN